MRYNPILEWEGQAVSFLSTLPSLSQLAVHVQCIRLSLPGPVYLDTFIDLVCIRIISLSVSVSCERGCSRLVLLSPAQKSCCGMPGSCPDVKEGTWCL